MNLNKVFDKQNVFLLLLVLMVFAGKLMPYKDVYNQYFDLGAFIDWGIAGIFFLYGLKLNLKEVLKDVSNWKLHLLVQSATFLLFPFIVLLFYPLLNGSVYMQSWLSVYFLACLPSTVSSSVVMVSIARGNVTSAIFNASVSGLIGIIATPLLMGFFMPIHGSGGGQLDIIYQLVLHVLLPIVAGILLNPFFKNIIQKYGKIIAEFDRLIILLIVYESFSKAFIENVFGAVPPLVFVVIAVSVISLFFIVYQAIKLVSRQLGFNRGDAITAMFCGSKKSLVHGSLFVVILGFSEEQKVLYLLPVLIYHAFQLFYVSWLAGKLSTKIHY